MSVFWAGHVFIALAIGGIVLPFFFRRAGPLSSAGVEQL